MPTKFLLRTFGKQHIYTNWTSILKYKKHQIKFVTLKKKRIGHWLVRIRELEIEMVTSRWEILSHLSRPRDHSLKRTCQVFRALKHVIRYLVWSNELWHDPESSLEGSWPLGGVTCETKRPKRSKIYCLMHSCSVVTRLSTWHLEIAFRSDEISTLDQNSDPKKGHQKYSHTWKTLS